MKASTQSLLLDAFFEGGRMFVGAVSAVYLLQKGISLTDLALLKSIQAIVVVFGELPTGLLADKYGRKVSLFCSLLLLICGFTFFILGESFIIFTLAEILTAMALCFWSGAFEALSIQNIEHSDKRPDLSRFFHLNHSINQGAVLLCGLLGGFLAATDLRLPYIMGVLFFFIAIFLLFRIPEYINSSSRVAKNTKLSHHNLMKYYFMFIGVQFLIQPLLHYWQPFFTETHSTNTKLLGTIFFLYSATTSVFSFLSCKLEVYIGKPNFKKAGMYFSLFSIGLILMAIIPGLEFKVFLFCITHGFLSLGRIQLSTLLNSVLENKNRASNLSFLNLISRIGMLASTLGIIPLILNNPSTELISLYLIYGMIGLMIVMLTVFFRKLSYNITRLSLGDVA